MGKYYGITVSSKQNEMAHHGIPGQKWGLRRFQYENGSYTPEGKERYRKNTPTAGTKAFRVSNDDLKLFSDNRHKENEKIVDETTDAYKKVFGNSYYVKSEFLPAYREYQAKKQSLVKNYQDLYKKNERISEIEREKDKTVKDFTYTEGKTRLTSLEWIFNRDKKNKEREEALDPIFEKYRKLNNERNLECTRIAKEVFKDLPNDQYLVAMALFGFGGGYDSEYNTVWKKDKIRASLRGKDFRM